MSFFRPYTPGVILPFLGRTHQGLFVRFCPQTQQGLNVRFCIQTQQGLTVRFSRLYINSQTNCTYHINKSINLFLSFKIIQSFHPKSTKSLVQFSKSKTIYRNFDQVKFSIISQVNIFLFHLNHPFLYPKSHRNS